MSSRIREPWSGRKARMKCKHSKMEQMLLIDFHLLGLDVMIDVPYKLKPTPNGQERETIPDFVFNKNNPKPESVAYVDGIPHRRPRRKDKDDAIRTELAETYPVHVIEVDYDHYSGKEEERLRDLILKELDQ